MYRIYNQKNIETILRKEALTNLLLTLAYILIWLAAAYFPHPYSIGISGLPIWFELSCIVTPIVFCLSVIYVVHNLNNLDFSL